MSAKSVRVGVSLSPELLGSLDALCDRLGYSRAAVLHSLVLNSLPEMETIAAMHGIYPVDPAQRDVLEPVCRYRGASAARLDGLICDLLLGLRCEEQLPLFADGECTDYE